MIYPIFSIKENKTSIEIIDTQCLDNPVLQLSSCEETFDENFQCFYLLLSLFVNSYYDGYDTGYLDSFNDFFKGEDNS